MEVVPATVSLASRACAGDAVALNELLAELRPLVVRATRLVVGSGSWAAEDAAQEALIDISPGISKLRDPNVGVAGRDAPSDQGRASGTSAAGS